MQCSHTAGIAEGFILYARQPKRDSFGFYIIYMEVCFKAKDKFF